MANRDYIISSKCNNLKRTSDQFNAYMDTVEKKLCCMCGAGTKWTGDCNSTDPTSTVCKSCHFNPDDTRDRFYIDYEPHDRTECFRQKVSSCVQPKILMEGSTKEEAKCVCPAHMIEKHRQCIEVRSTKSPAEREATIKPKLITRITQSVTDSSASKTSSGTKKLRTNASKGKFSTPNSPKHIMEPTTKQTFFLHDSITTNYGLTTNSFVTNDSNQHIKPSVNPGMPDLGKGLLAAGLIGFVISVVIFMIWRMKRRQGTRKNNGKSSQTSTPDNSRADLLGVRIESEPRTYDDGVISTDNHTYEGTPETNNKAFPFNREYSRVREYSIQHDVAEVQVLQNVDDLNIQAFNNYHDEFTPSECKKFALDLAKKWGSSIDRHQVKPVFRSLFKTNHDNIIDAKEKEYTSDIPEFVYQLMMKVQQNLGRVLNPRYILNRLNAVDPQPGNLIDITQDALNNWQPEYV
uniref:uncharacterized protein LOC120327535 n=1 Tax=Styela clava TaxID=7725 RepID=UPI001939FA83|nr:uncharacterized protein LOC120327535 [Styela clava]